MSDSTKQVTKPNYKILTPNSGYLKCSSTVTEFLSFSFQPLNFLETLPILHPATVSNQKKDIPHVTSYIKESSRNGLKRNCFAT